MCVGVCVSLYVCARLFTQIVPNKNNLKKDKIKVHGDDCHSDGAIKAVLKRRPIPACVYV